MEEEEELEEVEESEEEEEDEREEGGEDLLPFTLKSGRGHSTGWTWEGGRE